MSFSKSSTLALIGWLLLVLSRWVKALRTVVTWAVVPLLLSVAYIVIIAYAMPNAEGGFDSLAGVMALFENPYMVLAGWLHYLAFDLLIGTWIWFDAGRLQIPWWATVPALVLSFMLGPAGFVLHMLVRARFAKKHHANSPGIFS
ncbi:MAG: ABA4-like family protein [Verrucomicrobiota bacterium]